MKSPKAPDPKETAAAQAGMNVDTAQAQQLTNMVDQVGPDGSLIYTQNGNNTFVNSQGQTVTIPKYTATTSLSAGQQAIKDESDAAQLNLGKLANKQSSFLVDYLDKPFKADTTEAEDRLNALGSARLDPRFAREEEALRSRLIASGIRPGSEAFDQQMQQLGQTKNDAYNNLYLTGRSQALQEAYAERSQPINEIASLLSGAQVDQPNFVSTPQASVAGVDYMGAVNNNYQSQLQSYNAKMGGLFGLASAPFSMFSIPKFGAK